MESLLPDLEEILSECGPIVFYFSREKIKIQNSRFGKELADAKK